MSLKYAQKFSFILPARSLTLIVANKKRYCWQALIMANILKAEVKERFFSSENPKGLKDKRFSQWTQGAQNFRNDFLNCLNTKTVNLLGLNILIQLYCYMLSK